jgi:hypothetical protein
MDDPPVSGEAAPPIDAEGPVARPDSWDAGSPGALAYRLEQARQRYLDLIAERRAFDGRAALLLAAALPSAALAWLPALATLPALAAIPQRIPGSTPLLVALGGASVLALVLLLGALLDLFRSLPRSAAANPYRLDELGQPQRYLTDGDRADFTSSIGVLQYRQIQRLRPAVRELEDDLEDRSRHLRSGAGQLIAGLFLMLLPPLAAVLLTSLWPR